MARYWVAGRKPSLITQMTEICSTTITTPLEWGEGGLLSQWAAQEEPVDCGPRAQPWPGSGLERMTWGSPVTHVAALSFREMHKENIWSELELPEAEDLQRSQRQRGQTPWRCWGGLIRRTRREEAESPGESGAAKSTWWLLFSKDFLSTCFVGIGIGLLSHHLPRAVPVAC